MLVRLPTPALSQGAPATTPVQVRGEVLILTTELAVAKSPDGTSTLIALSKDTSLASTLEIGDQVEVILASGYPASSIKTLL